MAHALWLETRTLGGSVSRLMARPGPDGWIVSTTASVTLSLLSMLSFHLWLMHRGVTTAELWTMQIDDAWPYTRGVVSNLRLAALGRL